MLFRKDNNTMQGITDRMRCGLLPAAVLIGLAQICTLVSAEQCVKKSAKRLTIFGRTAEGVSELSRANIRAMTETVSRQNKLGGLIAEANADLDNVLRQAQTNFSNNIALLPEYSPMVPGYLTVMSISIDAFSRNIDAFADVLRSLIRPNPPGCVRVAEISITAAQDLTDYPVRLALTRSVPQLSTDCELLLVWKGIRILPYWIQAADEGKIVLWVSVPQMQKDTPATMTLLKGTETGMLTASIWNDGAKVFTAFVNRNTSSGMHRAGSIAPELNVLLFPCNDGLRIDTSLNRHDSLARISFPRLMHDYLLEYSFENLPLRVYSYQFQVSTYQGNRLLSSLDTPIYGRSYAAFRRQYGKPREVFLANMDFNVRYTARHEVRFDTQRAGYSLARDDTGDFMSLTNQHFLLGGRRCPVDSIPEGDHVDSVTFGSCCSDDTGNSVIHYLFLRKCAFPEPECRIAYVNPQSFEIMDKRGVSR